MRRRPRRRDDHDPGTISAGPDGVQHRLRTKTGESRTLAISSITLELMLAHRQRALEEFVLRAAG